MIWSYFINHDLPFLFILIVTSVEWHVQWAHFENFLFFRFVVHSKWNFTWGKSTHSHACTVQISWLYKVSIFYCLQQQQAVTDSGSFSSLILWYFINFHHVWFTRVWYLAGLLLVEVLYLWQRNITWRCIKALSVTNPSNAMPVIIIMELCVLFVSPETLQECFSVISLNVAEHLTLRLTSDIICVHTLEKSRTLAHMRAVAEILHRLVICVITSAPTVAKEPSNVSTLVVIVCLLGQHTWNTTWKLTQEIEHITALMKGVTKVFTFYSDWMFTWECTQENDLTFAMWRTAWNHSQHKETWRITWEYTLVGVVTLTCLPNKSQTYVLMCQKTTKKYFM